MARVKRGSTRTKKRRDLFKKAKGFQAGRKNTIRLAKTAVKKAGQRAYDHRKLKKRQMRGLWQMKIGAAAKLLGTSYSKLIGALKKANITLDRKILADLAENNPKVFEAVVNETK